MLYTVTIFAVMVASFAYQIRHAGIFACSGNLYTEDYYLGYCQGDSYGDYDHGAFWFDLEPDAVKHAAAADVLFLGNSRMAFGLSAPELGHWFSDNHLHYYLLGFSHNENINFLRPLLEKLHPRARAYVINVGDDIFVENETFVASPVMHSYGSRVKYEAKRLWQTPHQIICTWQPSLCGDDITFYRKRETGEWRFGWGRANNREDQGYALPADRERVARALAIARKFIADLPVDRNCIFLTYVPASNSDRATAAALAEALGYDLISPTLDGLQTFDGMHLAPESAERFVSAFLQISGPRIRECLNSNRLAVNRGENPAP
jgi:hypothetical protein